ncbi:PREDICTED: myosin-2 heavy chain isoform X2 [Nicrophorus vespilloides]|uniref:Myosin-2 heavy chain isoform X2 n=1 Tax=Nicrophorus vespilloides TaxID=110193 RepID=A0ABM1M9F1_NICVS|nr:PREDICTED: myosin-2 heavy chain isoform X2 [Nicrophorus vespilloides]
MSMHLYPMGKGDPLCPLGFHPQVRWPTRCKRCFRDYKEHGGKRRDLDMRKDDTTASTPSLGTYNSSEGRRSWASSTNLDQDKKDAEEAFKKNPSSWTSTPDLANLEDDTQANIPTVSLTLPLRKKIPPDTGQPLAGMQARSEKATVFNKSDSLATRMKKLQSLRESSQEKAKRIHIKEIKPAEVESSNDVQFLIQVKNKSPRNNGNYRSDSVDMDDDDTVSMAGTETTDSTTLVDHNEFELKHQLDAVKQELETAKAKCERLEKEKSNILLRRLTAMDTSKMNTSEVLKLQQKVNEFQTQLDDYKDEKKVLSLRVKELEDDLDNRPTPQAAQKVADELSSKLLAAETLCEELMDENEDIKKELRDLEDEMEEMQDHFREDQADEYSSLKKELEQTTKNCRILSFKLRKNERKTEQMLQEKTEADKKLSELSGGTPTQYLEKIKVLEKDLHLANEANTNLQKKLEETCVKLSKAEENKLPSISKRKAPMLASLGKNASNDMKVSRESLTRGGSQDDPVQLLRDLQDSLEREADLREQLKFAEEESQTMRKKVSRIEDDNESLVLQLKKMATRARPRKLTPTRDENKDEEDLSDVKLQLELSEQETSVLRKKLEDTESDNDRLKKKTKELQDKLIAKPTERRILSKFDRNGTSNEKVKSLENEMNEIRKKLIEKERDCERLEAEINLSKKRPKDLKSKSQDIDQQTIDLKRQLQVIEQEASVFRNKAQTLEVENEKLIADNKRLELLRGTKNLKADKALDIYVDKIATLEVDLEAAVKKIKDLEEKRPIKAPNGDVASSKQMKLMEKERDKLQNILNKLKEGSTKTLKNRKVHTPTDITTKVQLRTMVNDLENEISAILLTLEKVETNKDKLEEELSRTLKGTKETVNKELEDLSKKLETSEKELIKSKNMFDDLNRKLSIINEERDSLKQETSKMKSERDKILSDKKKTEEELISETSAFKESKKELAELKDLVEHLKRDTDKKENELRKLREEIEEKNKLVKELTQKTKKITDLQTQLKEIEEENKKSDNFNKLKIKQLEHSLDEEKRKLKDKDSKHLELSAEWTNKLETLSSDSKSLTFKIEQLETTIASKNLLIERLEKSSQVKVSETKELKNMQDEISQLKLQLTDYENKCKIAEKSAKSTEEKLKKNQSNFQTEKSALEKKSAELDIDLQNEKKKLQVIKTTLEKEQKNRDLELTALKNKIKNVEMNSGVGNKKITEIRQEYQDKLDKLEKEISKERKEYENLTAKYEVLEEEHVVTKAKLVTEKESLSSQLMCVRRELEKVEEDSEIEKDALVMKYEALMKVKNELAEKISKNGNGDLEKVRLKSSLEERQSELDQLKKEYEVINDQMEYMRRENEELRKKLDDFDKVHKIQRNISADSSAMGVEIRELKARLASVEKSKKGDLTELKMRYESQITILNEEMQSLHTQVSRFKRERDTYKHMLESAQKTIGDLKMNPAKAKEKRNSFGYDEVEEQKSKIAGLEQQISCMEDELSESRLESSKLKTELVSERSSWEVKVSELNSRVNELEEEKILSSGRTKIAGLRTRMELSWQKEREEQQRLLQETATLARDLRQTLFEVERERDKEVLEAKRKMDQTKKTLEEEQDENKKKLTELQCDFMELRDAHAKLRTTNEKLRREKERHEREREEMKFMINGKKRVEQEDLRRVNTLVQQVENLLQLVPELLRGKEKDPSTYTPTPPKRTKSKSRESSPGMERKDYSRESSIIREDKRTQVQSTLERLVDATDELKRFQRLSEEDRERERMKRQMGMRRATSTENDKLSNNGSTPSRKLVRKDSNLHRKSLSLEHTASMQDHNIWKGDSDSMSSMQSLDMGSDLDFRRKRDVSMDSRLSGGSTQSEVAGGEKRKKKGLIGKLKKLTKSRSIDDQDGDHFSPSRPLSSKPSSSIDMAEDSKSSKKDLKERITGMFRRAGSSSRSNSVERHDTSSTQRPLMRNGSNSNLQSKDSNSKKGSRS